MNHRIFSTFMAIVLALAVLGGNSPAKAQDPSVLQKPASEYRLLFSLPHLTPEDVPVGHNPVQAEQSAERILLRQFQELQPQLARYVQSGQVVDMNPEPERAGVLLQVADPAVLPEIERLPGVAGVYPADKSAACGEGVARSLQKALQTGLPPTYQDAAPLSTDATDPAVSIYHISGQTDGNVYVETIPYTIVSMRLWRSGKVVASAASYSGWYGEVSFDSGSSGACNLPVDGWELHDGDTVEVTAHGATVSTPVVPLRGWVDPVANKVGGATSPGKLVKVDLSTATGNNPCNFSTTTQSVTSNASGVFEKTYADFNRMAHATLSVVDANGNYTFMYANAYSINSGIGWGQFYFYWDSSSPVTVTYKRGATTLHTWNYTSLYAGSGYTQNLSGSETTKAGDVISVTSAGGSMSYTVVPLSGAIDLTNSRVTGTTGAGRLVQARIGRDYGASCNTDGCATATAGAGGAFVISTPLGRCDEVYLIVYDAEGNSQESSNYATSCIEAYPNGNYIHVLNWHAANPVTITLKSSSNAVKQTIPNYTPDTEFFSVSFSTGHMADGDKITITDGANTLNMTISNLAARLTTSTSRLAVTSSNGHLIARYYDFRRDLYEGLRSCSEAQVTTGSYSLAFSGAQFGPEDVANVYLTGADGNFTNKYLHTFGVWIDRDRPTVNGYTELPQNSVTVTAKRGSTTLDTWSGVSDMSGYFYHDLPISGGLQTGDVIGVTTGEGDAVNLTVPNMTLHFDSTNQRLYGNVPASQPFRVYFGVFSSRYESDTVGWMDTANASGQYSTSTVGRLLNQCQPVISGSMCSTGELDYYFPGKENWIYTYNDNALGVAADSFEADNTYTTAKAYTTVQKHTFDKIDDVDWVKFTVPQSAVTAHLYYQIMTFDLGSGMDTMLELYSTNGTTLLGQNDNYTRDGSSFIRWKPAAAGTYYVKVMPKSEEFTLYCGAYYSLKIIPEKARDFMPLLLK